MNDPTRAALSQPEPAGLSDEELLELMPQQFRDDLATVSRMAAHGAGPDVGAGLFRVSLNTGALEFARAAIAADRAQRQPVPPEHGEVQELVSTLMFEADAENPPTDLQWATREQLRRAADLLAQQYPQPVEPLPGEVQELVKWLREQEGWMGVRAIYSRIADLLAQRYPQPVPVSERLPGDELCWWFEADEDCGYGSNWTLLRIRGRSIGYTHWLPAHALPLPGEVEG